MQNRSGTELLEWLGVPRPTPASSTIPTLAPRKVELWRQERRELLERFQASIPSEYSGLTLDSIDVDDHNRSAVEVCRRYVASLPQLASDGVNLVLQGVKGTGKTGLAWWLMRAIVEAPKVVASRVAHETWVQFAYHADTPVNGVRLWNWEELHELACRQEKTEGSSKALLEAARVPFLALDDVAFTGSMDRWETKHLIRIVNERYEKRRPTFLTVNFPVRRDLEGPIDARIVDRLLQEGRCISKPLTGPSRRARR